MLVKERFKVCNKPALEPSKRPALIVLRGRITVDAREKD
jgi:hypothetical protein